MSRHALTSKTGEDLTWFEAVVLAMKALGHPATAQEIGDAMLEYVIVGFPDTAKTPSYTIYETIYMHSHDANAGLANDHTFYCEERGVWGLAEWQQ